MPQRTRHQAPNINTPPRFQHLRFLTTDADQGTPGAPTPTPPPAAGFTQEEVNAIAAQEKREGRSSAMREVTDKLGGLSLDDAAALIAAARAADDANKTQAQRDAQAAATARAEAERIQAEAAQDRHAARLERVLTGTGAVDVEVAAAALRVEVGADETTIKAAVDALKQRVPGLFTTNRPPHTDPGAQPPPPPAGKSGWDAGAEEAKRRFG